jgi:hypothetical protein
MSRHSVIFIREHPNIRQLVEVGADSERFADACLSGEADQMDARLNNRPQTAPTGRHATPRIALETARMQTRAIVYTGDPTH